MHHKMSIFEAISTFEGVAIQDTQMAMHHSVSQVPRQCRRRKVAVSPLLPQPEKEEAGKQYE